MRYGLNLLLWTDTLDEAVLPVLEDIKQIGYDAVEVPIFESDVAKYGRWGKRLDEVGLARTGVTIRGADDNPMSPEPRFAARGSRPTRRRWTVRPRPAARPWSARTTRPWAISAAPARRPTSGAGPPTACGRWPSTPTRPASTWAWNTSTASSATC